MEKFGVSSATINEAISSAHFAGSSDSFVPYTGALTPCLSYLNHHLSLPIARLAIYIFFKVHEEYHRPYHWPI